MTLIKSISGFRGTIGGSPNQNLTPVDIVNFASAFAFFIQQESKKSKPVIVVGRDARISGEMLEALVNNTLIAMGINVISLGLSTTPTVEMAVKDLKADGGIILTASHNPKHWNALKLLNSSGEFISAQEGESLLDLIDKHQFEYAKVDKLGKIIKDNTQIEKHIEKILALKLVDVKAIRKAHFKVAFDGVNSTGGLAILPLLKALGVEEVFDIYCEPTGHFPHIAEPLPENIGTLRELVIEKKADVGFVVDPDVDRLAIVSENGIPFGEEYTLVAVADYILSNKTGNTVSNLSSTRALRNITQIHEGKYYASAVGEVNVVEMMKKTNAIIGGEGNGGVIYPELHYGRDALVGIALFLSLMAKRKEKVSMIRSSFPDYFISKNKIDLDEGMDVDELLIRIADKYKKERISTIDGVKIDFDSEWVHLRKSNTEAIIRIYAESNNMTKAEHLADKIKSDIGEFIKN
jgi:phosphomannomutase